MDRYFTTTNLSFTLLLLLFILPFCFVKSEGVNHEVYFSNISIEDGLSQSTVYDLKQDSIGNLWIATADGLNKYDGYNFTVYRHNVNDSNSIQADYVRGLHLTNNDHLLIGTKLGLTDYDIRLNKFANFPIDKEIFKITKYSDTVFYMISQSQIYSYDMSRKVFNTIYSDAELKLYTIEKTNIGLLVGTDQGLFEYKNGKLVRYNALNALIQDIAEDIDGLWLASERKGLFFLANNGELTNFMPKRGDTNGLISPNVRQIEFDSSHRLWVGTMEGLSILDIETQTFTNHANSSIGNGNLSHNSIRSMLRDNQGGMWLGTYFGGLNYYHPIQYRFKHMKHIPFVNSLSHDIISCIVEDDNNNLWIGTNDAGLNKYNSKTEKFEYFNIENKFLLSNNVKTALVDDCNIYVGSHGGGLTKIDLTTKQVTHFTYDNSKLGSNDVYSLLKDDKGQVWVATLNGLKILNPLTQTFSDITSFRPIDYSTGDKVQELSDIQIFALYLDSKNRIWIGSELGVYTFSLHSRLLVHYDIGTAQKNERIHSFLEDHKGTMWIGMQSGLGRLDEWSQKVTLYNTSHGLPNNNVMGILEDSYKRLWISTNNGLACVNTSADQLNVRLYSTKDGIQGKQFNNDAYCKLKTGEMYFGGLNGITHFFPEQLIDNPFTPRVNLSDLKVINKLITPNDESEILSEDINFTSSITLPAASNSFSLLLSVPNFLSMKHDVFAYMLEDFDKDWNYMTEHNQIVYTNLKPGEYTLLTKAGNRDGKWSNEIKSLKVKVLPFWWETTTFRLIVLALFLIFMYGLFRFYFNKQILKNQIRLEQLEYEKREEIHQTKLRFFINISHEFRTPLTLIISPLKEVLNKNTDKWIKEQVEIVIRNANKMLHLVDQLMDYRKADLGVFALKVSHSDISIQVENQMLLFDRLSKQKNIDFVFENKLTQDLVLYDANYLDLILSNLLSNAFKFTPQNGAITINTHLENEKLILQVKDTGCGMSQEEIERAFERFYQAASDVKGTGVGLSLVKRLVELHHATIDIISEQHEGTSLIVSFPQDVNLYSEEEKLMDKDNTSTINAISESSIELISDAVDVLNDLDLDVDEDEVREDKATVLVVDDDPDVCGYIVANLRELANVERAANGKEALAIMNEVKIDMVVTDLMMPVMDGLALCKNIKQNIKTSHIPVIMLSAKTQEQDRNEGYIVGADSYINKPFEISVLKLRVKNMLQTKFNTLNFYANSLSIEPQKITFNELDREFLEQAKAIVENNLDNAAFSVDDFCQEIAMSRSNLHLKMKAITGESTNEFIKKIRFNEACGLLKDGRYSINDISVMVGFSTSSYFTTSFKKHFGISPTQYIRKLRN